MLKLFSLRYCFGELVSAPTISGMKQLKSLFCTLLLSFTMVGGSASQVAALPPVAPTPAQPTGLVLTQIKITGDEFVVLQNTATADITDLSLYSLKTFNNVNPLTAGATSAVQQLPATSLGAGQRLILSAVTRNTCGASIAGKLGLSFVDGGGFLEILQIVNGVPVIADSVSWNSGASGIIPNVPTSTKDPQGLYYRYANGPGFSWQLADQEPLNNCQLSVLFTSSSGNQKIIVPLTSLITAVDSAPATIVVASNDSEAEAATPNLPASDSGLTVPEITELLPNPAGSGNDASDEFIELYNPNDTAFDLSGFKLQTGISSVHVYTFSSGVALAPKSFTSFTTAMTGLSLSNNGGRAQLLDPSGTVLVKTDTYGTAIDGQAWALANGHWYWSLTPTLGAANIVTLPAPLAKQVAKPVVKPVVSPALEAKPKTINSSKRAVTPSPKASKANTPKAPKKPKATKTIAATPTAAAVTARPVQAKVVALVASLAVLYGAYEYRADLANIVHKLRGKLGIGRPDRS